MAWYLSKEKLNRKKAGPATKRYTERWNDAILVVKSMIHSKKVADVALVRHGRWIPFHSTVAGDIQYCSACEIGCTWKPDYCPNCGAKMDLGL